MKPGAGARLAILISGRGSNLQAFIDACDHSIVNAEIAVVISNNPGAEGLKKAADAGIPTRCIDHRDYPSRESFDTALVEEVQRWQADAVILAGFMRILTPVFIQPFSGCLLNVHPSLLPKYPGLQTHQRALDAGDSQGGVTVHFVTLELDGGPPIIQARVPILPGDTGQTLADRAIVKEHLIYPLAAQWLITGRLKLTDDGASLDGEPMPATGIDYPEQES